MDKISTRIQRGELTGQIKGAPERAVVVGTQELELETQGEKRMWLRMEAASFEGDDVKGSMTYVTPGCGVTVEFEQHGAFAEVEAFVDRTVYLNGSQIIAAAERFLRELHGIPAPEEDES